MFTRRAGSDEHDYDAQRAEMVKRDLASRGISDRRVLDAMGAVRRQAFVPDDQRRYAYRDRPLSIGSGQTISQPYIVALMAEAAELEPNDVVLEVGTGSGYGAAVLATLAGRVVTIERHRSLADGARRALDDQGITTVDVVAGDGTKGWAEGSPYNAIVVTAAGPEVPPELLEQLGPGGRLVMPVGEIDGAQNLVRIRRVGDDLLRDDLGAVRFVPLIADQ